MGKHTIDPQISAEHLAGAVRFATVSNADNSLTDYTKFDAFHEYLKETYPLVHKHLTLEHTGQAGLLYHWKGTGKSGAAPLLLMAHQDVVPEGDLEKWTYPPYSGTIADGKIWGRGSSDCKSNLIGQLEAVEALLEKGYEPDYDLYLSYGYMEEVAGGKIPAETLRGTGIRFGAVLDEGGGVRPGSDYGIDDKGLCTIGLCEKGYVDFELSYTAKGGHSSRPGENFATTMIAKALIAIQENPMPYRVTDTIRRRFEVLAPYMAKENPELAKLLEDNLDKNSESGSQSNSGIQVYIGEENGMQDMKDCSVVTARYDLGDGVQGTLGVVGPKRMDYEKVVGTLKNLRDQLDAIYKKNEP